MYNLISHLFTFCLWASKQNHTWTSSSKLHLFCCSVQTQKFFFSILLIVRTHMRVVYIKSGQLLGNCKEFKSSRKNFISHENMYGQNKETEQNNKIQAQQEHPLFSLCTICIYALYGGTWKYQNCKYFQQVKCFLLIPNT